VGGYVNISVRRAGAVQTYLSYSGALSRFFNPALYAGSPSALQQIFDVYPDIHLDVPEGGIRFAPYHYGLIVLDFDSRTLLDMQCARHLLQSFALSLPEPGIPTNVIFAAGKEGLLGDHLVDQISGKAAEYFPEGLFDSPRNFYEWIRDHVGARPVDLEHPWLPCFHLHPSDWTHAMYEREDSRALQHRLLQLDFKFSAHDQPEWDAWQHEFTGSKDS
jgi:hypothetical protein